MNIRSQQAILSRLYTDSGFRNDFISDKAFFYSRYSIPIETADYLEHISVEQLIFFADSLLKKRLHEVKQLLPLTFKLIPGSPALFLKFCDQYTPAGIHKHQKDAMAFVTHLLKQNPTDAFQRSAMRYEQQLIEDFTRTTVWCIRFYSYDLASNYSLLLKQEQLKPLPKKFSIVIRKYRKGVKRR